MYENMVKVVNRSREHAHYSIVWVIPHCMHYVWPETGGVAFMHKIISLAKAKAKF